MAVPSMMPAMMPTDDMMMMDDMMDMDMEMSMVMTFGDWDDYKLKLLFDDWDIKEKWQFALSWIAVMLSVIVYHFLKYEEGQLEEHMLSIMRNDAEASEADVSLVNRAPKSDNNGKKNNKTQSTYFKKLRVAHALLAGFLYGLALMLMLVVMTYNPSLFLAVIVGFVIGDFLFFHKRNFATMDSSEMDCH